MQLPKGGFTLVELTLATAVLVFVIVGMLYAFTYCLLLNEENNSMVTAAIDAQSVLEQLKDSNYGDIPAYSPPVFTNLNSEAVSLTRTVGSELTEVIVNVSWLQRGRSRSVELSTRFVE